MAGEQGLAGELERMWDWPRKDSALRSAGCFLFENYERILAALRTPPPDGQDMGASADPVEMDGLVERLTDTLEPLMPPGIPNRRVQTRIIAERAIEASGVSSLIADNARMREACERAIQMLAAGRHLIRKYAPTHHWMPEHEERIAALKTAIGGPDAGE